MTDQQHDHTPQKIKMTVAFVVFSAIFGPFILMNPPRFGSFTRREWIAIGIGTAAWGFVLEGIFGIGSGMMEAFSPR